MKYKWNYGANKLQRYYEAVVDGHYLCVFENKAHLGVWMGCYDNQMLYDKTQNDRVRKKYNLPQGHIELLPKSSLLQSDNPEYMQKKVEGAFTHQMLEISP